MALFSALAVAGALASVASVGVGFMQAAEQRKQGKFAREAEAKRQQQMNLEATRQKRQTIRQAQLQRAQAESVANAQGATESSGLSGALGVISGSEASTNLATNQNQEIGNAIFEANKNKATAMSNASMYGAISGGLGSLGSTVLNNLGTMNRLGNYYSGANTRSFT